MSFGTSHVGAYLLADKIVGSLLDTAPAGLVISIDLGGSLFDRVARNATEFSRHRFVGCPSLARRRSNLRSRGPKTRPSDIVGEPTIFGRVDGFMRLQDDGETFDSYAPHLEEITTRSIDSWATNRAEVRHIHFGDPTLTLDQWAGAAETVRFSRPTATFYTSGLDTEHLLSQLNRVDYRAMDVGATEVRGRNSSGKTDFGWIAIPAERYDEAMACLAREPISSGAEFFEWQSTIRRNSPIRQQRSREVFGLPAHALPLDINFSAGEIIVGDDCYPVESDGITSWRWLGPRSRSRIVLPCGLPGLYRVEIVVLASHPLYGLNGCRVLVEGREVRTTVTGSDQGTIGFVGHLEPRNYTGGMIVDLVTPDFLPQASGDSRVLRLNLQSISVSPWR